MNASQLAGTPDRWSKLEITDTFGLTLFDRYMQCLLQSKDNFRDKAPCQLCSGINQIGRKRKTFAEDTGYHSFVAKVVILSTREFFEHIRFILLAMHQEWCYTPVGFANAAKRNGTDRKTLSIATAGSTCVDFSAIGDFG